MTFPKEVSNELCPEAQKELVNTITCTLKMDTCPSLAANKIMPVFEQLLA